MVDKADRIPAERAGDGPGSGHLPPSLAQALATWWGEHGPEFAGWPVVHRAQLDAKHWLIEGRREGVDVQDLMAAQLITITCLVSYLNLTNQLKRFLDWSAPTPDHIRTLAGITSASGAVDLLLGVPARSSTSSPATAPDAINRGHLWPIALATWSMAWSACEQEGLVDGKYGVQYHRLFALWVLAGWPDPAAPWLEEELRRESRS